MKARLVLLLLILLAAHYFTFSINASPTEVISVRRDSEGVTLKLKSGILRLQVFSDRVVRVIYSKDKLPATKSFSVIGQPMRATWKLVETGTEVHVKTQALQVRVSRASGAVSFYDREGKALLIEAQRSFTLQQIGDLKTSKSRQEFVLPDDEAIYGLGQHQAGLMNYRNTIVHLQQENMKVAIPFLVSSRGYGLLWDNPSVTDVSINAGDKEPIPPEQLYDDEGKQGGLTGHYYRGMNFEELVRTQTDPAIDIDWGNTPPVSIPTTERRKKYSVRWTGSIEAKQQGDYTFFVSGGNGVRLWIDDKLLVDDWTSFSVDTNAARVHFSANSRHKIRVDYYHERWEGKVKLEWSEPISKPVVSWSSEVADAIDYYFMYGPELDQVIGSYRRLTGTAPMFGRWAWGFWQSKERYKSQQELLEVVGEYRKRNIPIDGIIQDWRYWDPAPWGSHEFDPARYPDPAQMMRDLHEAHVHMLISMWPKFEPTTENAKELRQVNGLYPQVATYMGNGQWLDPFNPEARRRYWQQISKKLFSKGLDGWWLDGSEPELNAKTGEFRDYQTGAGPGAKVYNAYPLMHTTGVYQGQRADSNDKRVLILTRSAYAGQQRNAAITWSGDTVGNWSVFARQIPAGINFSLSGIPYWNTDTGGFDLGDPEDAGYREVFTRWFEFSAFCPMLRVHGTWKPKEMWRFDEAAQKTLIDYDQLRYHLLPYIYSVSWKVTNEGYTMMRGLVMDFRHDRNVHNIPDQYLFGPAILVNPVTKPGAATCRVYLPSGTKWIDFWTGETYTGGQSIETSAPISTMPLFVRAGSIIPYGPNIQYAMGKSDPIELRVYRGANGAFTLYEDEGDNYNYEKGVYATIPISWNEAKQTLTIGKRQGSFPGMLKERTFRIVCVRQDHGIGIPNTEKADAVINYNGKAVTVGFGGVKWTRTAELNGHTLRH